MLFVVGFQKDCLILCFWTGVSIVVGCSLDVREVVSFVPNLPKTVHMIHTDSLYIKVQHLAMSLSFSRSMLRSLYALGFLSDRAEYLAMKDPFPQSERA